MSGGVGAGAKPAVGSSWRPERVWFSIHPGMTSQDLIFLSFFPFFSADTMWATGAEKI